MRLTTKRTARSVLGWVLVLAVTLGPVWVLGYFF